ncbi:hypothetical protein AB0H77_36295 [Streptomyces sp. NPDC050844]|uniref:hypothetical protein n=1 Tax=Streptomyces sp. NPDC050844 TaxID=3155790 RepID=UPI0033D01CAD
MRTPTVLRKTLLAVTACLALAAGTAPAAGNHGALKLSPTPETKAWIDEHFWHQMRAAY